MYVATAMHGGQPWLREWRCGPWRTGFGLGEHQAQLRALSRRERCVAAAVCSAAIENMEQTRENQEVGMLIACLWYYFITASIYYEYSAPMEFEIL